VQLLHEEDAPDDESLLEPPPMPNSDIFFTTLSDEHFGQHTAAEVENTSFSKSLLHLLHLYSYIGILKTL
jgi:hypothetical protein